MFFGTFFYLNKSNVRTFISSYNVSYNGFDPFWMASFLQLHIHIYPIVVCIGLSLTTKRLFVLYIFCSHLYRNSLFTLPFIDMYVKMLRDVRWIRQRGPAYRITRREQGFHRAIHYYRDVKSIRRISIVIIVEKTGEGGVHIFLSPINSL